MSKLFALAAVAGVLVFTPAPAHAAPASSPRPAAVGPLWIANLAESTKTACDPTGHCGRMHVVVQSQNGAQLRSFASVACYGASGDFPCAAWQGSTWLNCTGHNGADCGVDGPVVSCGAQYGKPACPAVINMISPWYSVPIDSQNYQGVGSGLFTTGAAGGGSKVLQALTVDFGF